MHTRTVKYLVLTVATAVFSTAQAEDAKKPSKEEFQKLYSQYLTEEGYRPEIDEDGDVRFKREGRTYFIYTTEQDAQYFSVVLPNIWAIESEEERSQVLAAADAANAKAKVAKVFTVDDDVWVSIELFVARPEDFKGVFDLAMHGLEYGATEFVGSMRDLTSETTEPSPSATKL
ncbi:MAG TPA: hypothetical protein VHK24_12530 [Steroidobacter sp.]|nr:hypothetical protein [Steroidobacter sp.]